MKILLIGASGMIGSRILAEATARGHSVIATSRHPEKIAAAANVTPAAIDATDANSVAALAKDADVIVSATSPRGGGNPIDEAASVGDALIAAAQQTGKRLFVVGGAGSLNLPDGTPLAETLPEAYRGEALGMRGVRDKLKASSVNWTFFSPSGMIRPGERTTQYRLGTTTLLLNAEGKSEISAEDYAHAVVNELESPQFERAQFTAGY